jgi:GT2 family glycosyltransferase
MWLLMIGMDPIYSIIIRSVCGATSAAAGANLAAQVFLEEHKDAEWLGIVDNDCVPPDNMLRILDGVSDETDIIGPVSHMYQQFVAKVQQGCGGYDQQFCPVDPNVIGQFEVDQVGGGCWFTRRRVFERMTRRPFFAEAFDPDTFMISVSDDVYFQRHARELGCRLICDTRFVVSHYHSVDLSTFKMGA